MAPALVVEHPFGEVGLVESDAPALIDTYDHRMEGELYTIQSSADL